MAVNIGKKRQQLTNTKLFILHAHCLKKVLFFDMFKDLKQCLFNFSNCHIGIILDSTYNLTIARDCS